MGNQPEKKFKAGAITATVWKNTGKDKEGKEFEFQTVSIDRNYMDKEKKWQTTNTMRVNDLPKLAVVTQQAYEYLVLKEQDDSKDKE